MRGGFALAIAVSVLAGSACARPATQHPRTQAESAPQRQLAEQAFQQARALVEQNRWEEACARFEDSLRSEVAIGTQLNLARCDEHIGKLASALDLYVQARDAAAHAGDIERRDYAQSRADALEPRVPRLAVVGPTPRPTSFAVTLDGAPIDADGGVLRVNPGAHRIVVSAPGYEPFTRVVSPVEGGDDTVQVPDLATPSVAASSVAGQSIAVQSITAPSIAAPTGAHVTSAPASRWTPRTYAALTIGAVGVAATGVGLWFGAKAFSARDEARALCEHKICAPENGDRGNQLDHDKHTSATASTVLVIAGGAAIAAGAAIWFTAPTTRERATARLAPVVHDRGAGLAVLGRF